MKTIDHFLSFGLCMALWATASNAQGISADTAANKITQNALEEIGTTPWYDPATKSVVPLELKDRRSDTIHRNSRWVAGPKQATSPTTSTPSNWFNTGLSTGNLVGWLLLSVAFVAVCALILYAFSRLDQSGLTARREPSRDQDESREQLMKRMDELPAEIRRPGMDLRGEAQRLMGLGQLDEAVKCLFGHQLLLLDRRGMLQLSRGKTNGKYVTETRRARSEAAKLLGNTVAAFEASYFGRHTPTAESFRQLWSDNERLESIEVESMGSAK